MPTKIILIRHGETGWSRQRRYCGTADVDLNKTGKKQARQLCGRLSAEKIHKAYASTLKRVFNFAKMVIKDMPIEGLSELREMNFGIFEGLTYQEIMDRHPQIYKKWLDKPLSVTIPDGESPDNLAKRVKGALAKILSENDNRTVAIFTHAGPIRIILHDIMKLGPEKIWQIKQDLAHISIVEFNNGEGRVQLINDGSHLNG